VIVLGIETSCDETGVAVVQDGAVLANLLASQVDIHERFGGVVPELASRAHVEALNPLLDEALQQAGLGFGDLDGIAVTVGPGLIGALLVGIAAAKSIALATGAPLIGVNHLEGHILANAIEHGPELAPAVCLVVSGGHTMLVHMPAAHAYELLGQTVDDAAGEAFDKAAKMMGLPYPGGVAIDRAAREGDPARFHFPRAWLSRDAADFSFSGLKTALLYAVRELDEVELESRRADLAASYQRAIVRALVTRVREAAEQAGREQIAIVGGVAANSELRAALPEAAAAPLAFCTDNAAMIASAARFVEPIPYPRYLSLDAYSSR